MMSSIYGGRLHPRLTGKYTWYFSILGC